MQFKSDWVYLLSCCKEQMIPASRQVNFDCVNLHNDYNFE